MNKFIKILFLGFSIVILAALIFFVWFANSKEIIKGKIINAYLPEVIVVELLRDTQYFISPSHIFLSLRPKTKFFDELGNRLSLSDFQQTFIIEAKGKWRQDYHILPVEADENYFIVSELKLVNNELEKNHPP